MASVYDLPDAVIRIADSLDRLVTLAEDLANAMGRADWLGQENNEEV